MTYESKRAIDLRAAAVAISKILELPSADVEALSRCVAHMGRDARDMTLGDLVALVELMRRD